MKGKIFKRTETHYTCVIHSWSQITFKTNIEWYNGNNCGLSNSAPNTTANISSDWNRFRHYLVFILVWAFSRQQLECFSPYER